MTTLRLGTRKSALAQAQAKSIAQQLQQLHPDLPIEIVLITTTGDAQSSSSSITREQAEGPGGLKALFTKELEEALFSRHIDLAVHSLKDMAATLPAGLIIEAIPRREDPRDVWISKGNIPFKELPKGARIGTGAVRRRAQLLHLRPDLQIVPVRGNVDTRLRKLQENDWDGIILARAGLCRLGRDFEATETLPADLIIPAVGQGCLALEIRDSDENTRRLIQPLDHPTSHLAARAERTFLEAMGGSCQTPLAAYAQTDGHRIQLTGFASSPEGEHFCQARIEGSAENPELVGQQLAKELLRACGGRVPGNS